MMLNPQLLISSKEYYWLGKNNHYSDHTCRYFEDDKELPYLAACRSYSAEEVLCLLFDANPSLICGKQPVGFQSNGIFIVDSKKLNHLEYIRADNLGVWNNRGVRTTYFGISFCPNGSVK